MKKSTLILLISITAFFLVGSTVLAGLLLSQVVANIPDAGYEPSTDRSSYSRDRESVRDIEPEIIPEEDVIDWGLFDWVEEEDDYSMALYWPETDSPQVNAEIDRFIEDAHEEFRGIYNEYPPLENFGPYALDIDWTVSAGQETTSVQFHEYWYTGGAHPSAFTRTWTWDNTSKEILTLEDVFGSGALEQIAQAARSQLLAQEWTSADDEWFLEGTEPTLENYSAWWIGEDTLYVQFQQYQIAAYAAGAPTVEIPLSTLN